MSDTRVVKFDKLLSETYRQYVKDYHIASEQIAASPEHRLRFANRFRHVLFEDLTEANITKTLLAQQEERKLSKFFGGTGR